MATSSGLSTLNPGSGSKTRNVNLTTDAMEECSQKLASTLLAGGNSRFDVVSCCISCTLVAARPLSVPELMDGVTTYFEAQRKPSPISGMRTVDFLNWLQQYDHPFLINGNIQVTFEHEMMPHFLETIPVRGIDNTHRTLALICLQTKRRAEESHPRTNSALASYALHFWKYHCNNAAGDSGSHSKSSMVTIRGRARPQEMSFSESNRGVLIPEKHTGESQR